MTIHDAGSLIMKFARLSNESVKVILCDLTPRVIVGREQGVMAIRVVQLLIPVTLGRDGLCGSETNE